MCDPAEIGDAKYRIAITIWAIHKSSEIDVIVRRSKVFAVCIMGPPYISSDVPLSAVLDASLCNRLGFVLIMSFCLLLSS